VTLFKFLRFDQIPVNSWRKFHGNSEIPGNSQRDSRVALIPGIPALEFPVALWLILVLINGDNDLFCIVLYLNICIALLLGWTVQNRCQSARPSWEKNRFWERQRKTNRNLKTFTVLLKSQAHQGTSLFTVKRSSGARVAVKVGVVQTGRVNDQTGQGRSVW